ncbi:hypothetical protein ACQCSU_16970 [Pseudarthrobacter sp. O4]|uniref:hypothetical protein n=1 Tax=Pseudarthrobacter sp. O4 TaxID=3418417 RepID=UPI003CEB31D2
MDALVPARISGTPFSVPPFSGTPLPVRLTVSPHPASAPYARRSATLRKPRRAWTAPLLRQRKPSPQQDEHPP